VHDEAQRHRHGDHLCDEGRLFDLATLDHQEPEHECPDAARAEPADEHPLVHGDVAAEQRGVNGDEPHHEQRDHREHDHPPAGVPPADDHGVAAEHREHHEL
jgi:hypothetical protein